MSGIYSLRIKAYWQLHVLLKSIRGSSHWSAGQISLLFLLWWQHMAGVLSTPRPPKTPLILDAHNEKQHALWCSTIQGRVAKFGSSQLQILTTSSFTNKKGTLGEKIHLPFVIILLVSMAPLCTMAPLPGFRVFLEIVDNTSPLLHMPNSWESRKLGLAQVTGCLVQVNLIWGEN